MADTTAFRASTTAMFIHRWKHSQLLTTTLLHKKNENQSDINDQHDCLANISSTTAVFIRYGALRGLPQQLY